MTDLDRVHLEPCGPAVALGDYDSSIGLVQAVSEVLSTLCVHFRM